MNFLGSIGKRLRLRVSQRAVTRRFQSYVDPKLVEYMLAHPEATSFSPRSAQVDFILAVIDETNEEKFPELVEIAVQKIRDNRGFVKSRLGPILFGIYGAPKLAADAQTRAAQRTQTVLHLQEQLGPGIRIVHGSTHAIVGDFACQYGAIIPRFSTAVQLLLSLQPGEARVWPDEFVGLDPHLSA